MDRKNIEKYPMKICIIGAAAAGESGVLRKPLTQRAHEFKLVSSFYSILLLVKYHIFSYMHKKTKSIPGNRTVLPQLWDARHPVAAFSP